MKTTNSKTLSRQLWEAQYNYIAACNPLVKILLPFNDILTKDMSEIKEHLTRATAVTYNGYPTNCNIPSPELQRVVLTELNSYGHSLVLVDNDTWTPLDPTITDAMRNIVFSEKREVNVNILNLNYYVRLQGEDAFVVFGNNTYTCKHISIIMENENTEYYFPVNGSNRVFVAKHSTRCRSCKNKTCIHNATKSSIRLYDAYDCAYIDTPSRAYDIHRSGCDVAEDAYAVFKILGKALIEYNNAVQQRRERKYPSAAKHSSSSKGEKSKSIRVVNTVKETTNEVWVDVNSNISTVHASTGSHATPIAHTVNGYWRRRSKKDDTMIFVESFARGGSEDERKKLSMNITTKQKVFRV